MSTTGGFLARMGIAKAGKLGDAVITALVSFDPQTASQVQIDQMAKHCQDLAARVAKAEPEEERTHALVTQLQANLARTAQAAHVIGDRLKTTTDPTQVTALNGQLTTLMDQIEEIGGPEMDGSTAGTLFEAAQDHTAAENDLHEWQTAHAGYVASLTTAKSRLEHAAKDMARAQQQADRAKEQQQQAEQDAGLKAGLDTNNVAFSAMEQRAAALKQVARASQINTDGLRAVANASHSADDIVNATLAAATTAESPLDRLARLSKAA
jgi:chromosome segregation ATPase